MKTQIPRLYNSLQANLDCNADAPPSPKISTGQDIPKDEMDIFYRNIEAFIPEGKTWDQLTPKEQKKAIDQYRFDPMRPGCYQGITGYGKMIN